MRVIAAIQNPDVITAILAAVHSEKWFIPATGPPGHPAPHEPIAA